MIAVPDGPRACGGVGLRWSTVPFDVPSALLFAPGYPVRAGQAGMAGRAEKVDLEDLEDLEDLVEKAGRVQGYTVLIRHKYSLGSKGRSPA